MNAHLYHFLHFTILFHFVKWLTQFFVGSLAITSSPSMVKKFCQKFLLRGPTDQKRVSDGESAVVVQLTQSGMTSPAMTAICPDEGESVGKSAQAIDSLAFRAGANRPK